MLLPLPAMLIRTAIQCPAPGDLSVLAGYFLKISSCWLSFILICSHPKVAEAAGHFEVDILSVGKAFSDDPNGPCCTKGIINQAKSSSNSAHTPSLENNTLVKPSSQCSGICRPYFRMCFKQFQRSIILNGDCMYGQGFSPVLRLPYISPRNSQLGSTTPTPFSSINDIPFVSVNLPFDFTWMRSYTLILELLDARGMKADHSTDTVLEQAVQSEELGPLDGWRTFSHAGKSAVIGYRVRVTCDENYGNVTCQAFCKARNDHFGHWYCSPDAEKICMDGWTGSNCDKAICAAGCQNGDCSVPGDCRCRSGWSGHNCDQCAPHQACKHGSCYTKPWECVCEKDWGGPMCDRDLNYCSKHRPCFNHALCYNTDTGIEPYECRCPVGYGGVDCSQMTDPCLKNPCVQDGQCFVYNGTAQCRCPPGTAGLNCESSVTDCSSDPCVNGGICEDEPGFFRCICPEGFTGTYCNIESTKIEAMTTEKPTTVAFLLALELLPNITSLSEELNQNQNQIDLIGSDRTTSARESSVIIPIIVSTVFVLLLLLMVLLALFLYRRRQRLRQRMENSASLDKYSTPSNNHQVSKDLLQKDHDSLAQRHNQDNEVKLKILNNMLKESKLSLQDEVSTKSGESLQKLNVNRTESNDSTSRSHCNQDPSATQGQGPDGYNRNAASYYNNKDTKNSLMESLRAAKTRENNERAGMVYFSSSPGDAKSQEDFTVV